MEYDNLFALYKRTCHFTYYLCALYDRRTYRNGTIIVGKQYFVKFDAFSLFCILNVVHEKEFACLGLKLLAAYFYNCVHICIFVVVPGGVPIFSDIFSKPLKDFRLQNYNFPSY